MNDVGYVTRGHGFIACNCLIPRGLVNGFIEPDPASAWSTEALQLYAGRRSYARRVLDTFKQVVGEDGRLLLTRSSDGVTCARFVPATDERAPLGFDIRTEEALDLYTMCVATNHR